MANNKAGLSQYRYRRLEKDVLGMIESGVLKPGEKLPSLRKLSFKSNMSLSTVLQAYMELEKRGVIESRPRSGFFVRPDFRVLPRLQSKPKLNAEPKSVRRSRLIEMVLDTVGRDDILPLGVAYPEEGLLPVKTLGRLSARVIKERQGSLLGYEPVAGNAELRRQIAFRSLDTGVLLEPDDIIITSGALEAMFIALKVLTKPGDNVLIPCPSYFGFLQLLEGLGLRAVEIRSDPDTGIIMRDVYDALNRFDIKACLITPNFSNPDGSLMHDDGKEELVNVLGERSIPIIEDDIYGEIYFTDARPSSCGKFDKHDNVLYCSSFSKTLAPGYRVGWLYPGKFYDQALRVKMMTNMTTATPTQSILAEYLRAGYYDRYLRGVREKIESQVGAMQVKVRSCFPEGTRAARPKGGMVLWVELPGKFDSAAFFMKARDMGIGIAPGVIFANNSRYDNCVRLGCGNIWSEKIEKGVLQLGKLANTMSA